MDHRFTRRQVARMASGATLAAAVASAGAAPFGPNATFAQDATPVAGGTLTFGSSAPIQQYFHPFKTGSTSQNIIIEALFLRLVYGREWTTGINPPAEGPLELGVAETMTEIEADRVWEFTLRQNVLWHDGQPVTADDLIFGIWLALNRNTAAVTETLPVGILGGQRLRDEGATEVAVEGAQKIGDFAVRIELEKPIPNYWADWGVGYWPMPVHILGGLPLDQVFEAPFATMPVGNGPFKVRNYVEGQYIEMEANPDFYLGRPLLDTYIIRFGDGATLQAAMEAGEIDGLLGATERIAGLPFVVSNPVPSAIPSGFYVDFARVSQAAAVHKAIMHAVDVQTISEVFSQGTLRPSNYLFEHVVGLETPPPGFPTYAYDPDAARAILAEAGYDTSRELRWITSEVPGPQQDAVRAMLDEVGIRTVYRQVDPSVVQEEIYQGSEWELSEGNVSGDQKLESLWGYLRCGSVWEDGGFNRSNHCNPEVDALWEEGLTQTDPVLWKETFDRISLLFGETPPHATLYRGQILYAWNERVQGAYPYQYRLPVRPPFERVWVASE